MSGRYSKGIYGAGLYSADEDVASSAISSWSFAIDGHQFVFLQLGAEGTYVFDVSTSNWYYWGQDGHVGLGLSGGQTYNELSLMGSADDSSIYTLDPDSVDDFSGPFQSVVTGGLQVSPREVLECFGAYVSGNLSEVSGRSIELTYSDDGGKTWMSAGSNSPQTSDEEVAWRSLGVAKYPGRLFQIVDDGVLASIDGLTMTGGE